MIPPFFVKIAIFDPCIGKKWLILQEEVAFLVDLHKNGLRFLCNVTKKIFIPPKNALKSRKIPLLFKKNIILLS